MELVQTKKYEYQFFIEMYQLENRLRDVIYTARDTYLLSFLARLLCASVVVCGARVKKALMPRTRIVEIII